LPRLRRLRLGILIARETLCLAEAVGRPSRRFIAALSNGLPWAGAEAWARDLGRKKQWDNWTRECSDHEYVSIAKVEMEIVAR
jgi:hypothetical protein